MDAPWESKQVSKLSHGAILFSGTPGEQSNAQGPGVFHVNRVEAEPSSVPSHMSPELRIFYRLFVWNRHLLPIRTSALTLAGNIC